MIKKDLVEFESMFLDSGILIDLLKTDLSGCNANTVSRIESIRLFFNSLKNPKTGGSKKRRYLISTISIAEIFHVDGHNQDTINAINSVMNSQEVEIHSFDEYTALYHNKEFATELGNKRINDLKKEINYPVGGSYANVAGRIRKDIMIAATAKMNGVDITLTTDKGFKDLCVKLNINCYLFNEDKSRFTYDHAGSAIFSVV